MKASTVRFGHCVLLILLRTRAAGRDQAANVSVSDGGRTLGAAFLIWCTTLPFVTSHTCVPTLSTSEAHQMSKTSVSSSANLSRQEAEAVQCNTSRRQSSWSLTDHADYQSPRSGRCAHLQEAGRRESRHEGAADGSVRVGGRHLRVVRDALDVPVAAHAPYHLPFGDRASAAPACRLKGYTSTETSPYRAME